MFCHLPNTCCSLESLSYVWFHFRLVRQVLINMETGLAREEIGPRICAILSHSFNLDFWTENWYHNSIIIIIGKWYSLILFHLKECSNYSCNVTFAFECMWISFASTYLGQCIYHLFNCWSWVKRDRGNAGPPEALVLRVSYFNYRYLLISRDFVCRSFCVSSLKLVSLFGPSVAVTPVVVQAMTPQPDPSSLQQFQRLLPSCFHLWKKMSPVKVLGSRFRIFQCALQVIFCMMYLLMRNKAAWTNGFSTLWWKSVLI